MASIRKRGKKHVVIYYYTDNDGKKKQKWEPFESKEEAVIFKKEIEYKLSSKLFKPPSIKTLRELLDEFVNFYAKDNWALSTYNARMSMIENYIKPLMGDMKLEDITTLLIDNFYSNILPHTKAALGHSTKESGDLITNRTVHEINKVLSVAFDQAIRWGFITINPTDKARLPKIERTKREMWSIETFKMASASCENALLNLCMHLSVACSLRDGELLALTWKDVFISDEDIESGSARIIINKTLARATKQALLELNNKDVIFKFPSIMARTKTVLILKKPKTESSYRTVFIPKTVAKMLQRNKIIQEKFKDLLGSDYHDYNMVIALNNGRPLEERVLINWFHKLISTNDLPNIVFHDLRHTSATYKDKFIYNGDKNSLKFEMGHSEQSSIDDKLYANHDLIDIRREGALLFEEMFYSNSISRVSVPTDESTISGAPDEATQALIKLLMDSPELSSKILKSLNNTDVIISR